MRTSHNRGEVDTDMTHDPRYRDSRGAALPRGGLSPALPGPALVVGLGRSGQAAALALARRGVEVIAAARSPAVELGAEAGRLREHRVELHLGNEEESLLDGVVVVVKSPGVPGESPLPAAARARGIPVWSEVELGYRLLRDNALLGVTGTNGKTTTTELLAAMLRAAGRPVAAAGNIGTPLTEVADHVAEGTSIVCELSSFQLEDVHELSCDVAVLLNLEADHLDRHGSFDAYRDAKLRIFERARQSVVPRGLGLAGLEFAGDDPLPAEPLIPGAHNRENAAAATVAARAVGVDDKAIAHALRTFAGVPHRLELVRELHGVRYVNDSKATNTAAARRGIAAYDAPLRLILGGSRKGEDFTAFARGLPPTIRSIELIGETADELAAALGAAGRPYRRAGDLTTAVAAAAADAQPGDVVLLSPACASYDQFENYEHRGAEFRRLVEGLG
jgi:UDP-N-acetylmuramoylalanine--D-glutamate ligase